MKQYVLAALLILISSNSVAGRSGVTTITKLIVKEGWIEVNTVAGGGCGTDQTRWHLMLDHPNYNAMYSGLLASKVSGKKVDIVGNNTCGVAENISWAYVVI